MARRVAAIVPAAGLGARLSAGPHDPPKALRPLAGRSILQRSIDVLTPFVDHLVVAAPPNHVRELADILESASVSVVAGGATRQQSVSLALAEIPDGVEWVLVHDAARALVPADVVRRVLAALASGATCVVPVVPATDSLRSLTPHGTSAPLARAAVRLVQTPQGFTLTALRGAHASAADEMATDDASMVEATGETAVLVDGDPRAFKITHDVDLRLAEALLS